MNGQHPDRLPNDNEHVLSRAKHFKLSLVLLWIMFFSDNMIYYFTLSSFDYLMGIMFIIDFIVSKFRFAKFRYFFTHFNVNKELKCFV